MAENDHLPLTWHIALTTVYALTCYTVICVFCLLVVLARLSVPVQVIGWKDSSPLVPHAGSGVERIDPLRFLAGCCKRQLNQTLFVLSLNLAIFECVCCAVN